MSKKYNKNFSKEEIGGMTVNERLFHTDLLDTFDNLKKSKRYDELRVLLEEVFVDAPSIKKIIKEK